MLDICPSRDDAQPHLVENGRCVMCEKRITLKRFTITFQGRKKGSIGIFEVYTMTIDADDIGAAVSKLYETHEHIRIVTHNNGTAQDIDANVAVNVN